MIGRKLGMTQIFDKDGNVIPVTIVEVGPCTVVDVREDTGRVILGYGDVKESRIGKPQLGFFKKQGAEPRRILREFRSSDTSPYKVGMPVSARVFKPGDYVDVSGTSIGKGFQGGMKRHGWSGGPGGHGSMHHRRVGSIGMSADPSRTLKGRTMPGQMGNKRATTQGLRVMDIDADRNIALLKGAVPGHKNGIVTVQISRKKKWRDLNEVKAVVQHKVNPMKQSKAKAGAKKKGK
ncbi:MAG: 50S ribosomal protein L3 [Candidatus Omnitrophica bacterium]|nr:50S ribosomal protein L3 [Candidatus Omnitrophota bacterium]MCB9720687.1 50S ribosomal protein L3 [Candidatus Omnitrophota bacterium]